MPRYSQPRICKLLAESDNAATSDEKGDKLEQLVCYLFSKVPGIEFHDKNVLDGNRAHELDVIFWNELNQSAMSFLDPVIIVECKNTGHPIGSADVGWFVRKLQDRGANYGVLIALNGITGAGDGRSNAHSEVLSALTRDKIKLLIVDRSELTALVSTDDLVILLRQKVLTLMVQKVIS